MGNMGSAHPLVEVNSQVGKIPLHYQQNTIRYHVTLTTPASRSVLLPLLKVEASVEEQDSSYPAVWPSLVAELMEMVHMDAAYPSQLQSSSCPPSPLAHT